MQLSLLNNLRFEEFPEPDWEGTSQYTALMFDLREAADNSTETILDGLFFNTTALHGACRSALTFCVFLVHFVAVHHLWKAYESVARDN